MTTTEAGTASFLSGPEHQAFAESAWADCKRFAPDLRLAAGQGLFTDLAPAVSYPAFKWLVDCDE